MNNDLSSCFQITSWIVCVRHTAYAECLTANIVVQFVELLDQAK